MLRATSHRYFGWFCLALTLWLSGCASLPSEVQRPTSLALTDNTDTRLGKAVASRAAQASTRNDSAFALVGSAELVLTSSWASALIEPGLSTGAYRVELVKGQLIWRAPAGSGLPDATSEPNASLGLKLLVKIIGPFAPYAL